ncbi:hypothetical protein McanMca71_007778 [Microsporum canis]
MSNQISQCTQYSYGINQTVYLTMLPNELILLIAEKFSQKRDLNSLLRCNRRLHGLLNQQLYQLDARSRNNDAMWRAVDTADVDLAKRAIAAGSDPNKRCEAGIWARYHPLFVAVVQARNTSKMKLIPKDELPGFLERNDSLIRYLVSQGADVNHSDNYQESPLWKAVSMGEITSVRLFLDNGADVSMQDCQGSGLAHLVVRPAQSSGQNALIYLEILNLLLEHGLDPNTSDRSNYTPLHEQMNAVSAKIFRTSRTKYRTLSEERVEDVLKLLLKYGADIDARSRFGETPLSMALEFLQDEPVCFKLLLHYGADTSLVSLPTVQEKREAALKVCDEISQATGKTYEFLTE